MSEALRFHDVGTIACELDPKPWDWAEAEAGRIDAHWAGLVAAKPALYDGPVLLLHRASFEDDAFRGAYLQTRFSRFMAWRDFGMPDRSIRNGFAMAALRAADGAFLLGEMGGHTANAGRVYFPSGTPDPSDIVDGRIVDLAGSVARELAEETGLAPEGVAFGRRWTVIEDGQRVAMLQPVTLPMSAEEARARILETLSAQAEPELAGIRVVRTPDDLDEQAMPPFVLGYLRRELARRD